CASGCRRSSPAWRSPRRRRRRTPPRARSPTTPTPRADAPRRPSLACHPLLRSPFLARGRPERRRSRGPPLGGKAERVFGRAVRHRQQVSEVDVELVVSLAAIRPEGTRPRGGQRLPSQRRVSLDGLAVVEEHVANAIDVDRGAPAVRRGVRTHRVARRPIAAVRRDVHIRAAGATKALEAEREHRDRARYVARKPTQWRSFADVGLNELPEREARRELDVHRLLPRGYLVEVPRQPPRISGVVDHNTVGQQRVAQRLLETQPVDDAQRKPIGLTHRTLLRRRRQAPRTPSATRRRSSPTAPTHPAPTQ